MKTEYDALPNYVIIYVQNEGEEWKVVSGLNNADTMAIYERGYFDDFRPMQPKRIRFFKKAIFRQVSNDEQEQKKWLETLKEGLLNA